MSLSSPSFSRLFNKNQTLSAALPSASAVDAVPPPPPLGSPEDQRAAALAKERRNKWKPYFLGPLRVRRAGEREALILTLLCALDMYTTLWWVMTGRATESNENLAWTFQHHPALFVVVKCGSCLPALMLAPRLARRHPKFTMWLLRGIIFAYVAYYLMNVS